MAEINDRKARRPTSYDVAKLAGVSQATVSLVLSLRGAEMGISSETEKRVREAARSLSYYPNSLVRSIQRGRTGIVGVYGRDSRWSTQYSYWIEALGALHNSAADLDKELLLFSDSPGKSRDRILERMLSGIIDGIIVQPGADNTVLEDIVRSAIPVVCIGDVYADVPSIAIDNSNSFKLLIDHLVERGHRSLAMLNLEQAHFGSSLNRQNAFCEATEAGSGLSGVVVNCDIPDIPAEIERLRSTENPPTALLCFNDEYAYNAIQYCLDVGLRVPEDIAITGFDGIPLPFAPIKVTTMRSPINEMCRLAVERLVRMIDGAEPEPNTILQVEFTQGQST